MAKYCLQVDLWEWAGQRFRDPFRELQHFGVRCVVGCQGDEGLCLSETKGMPSSRMDEILAEAVKGQRHRWELPDERSRTASPSLHHRNPLFIPS